LGSNPEHQDYFNQLTAVWKKSIRLNSLNKPNAASAWQRFQQRVRKDQPTPVVNIRSILPQLRVAAVVLWLLTSVVIGWVLLRNNPSEMKEVSAAIGPVADTLPDGSEVTLNKNATLSYPSVFNGKTRPVQLKGEAFFKVTPDKQKPFVITAGNLQVTVVGTSFNIKQTATVTEVIVETGLVKVKASAQEVVLAPGEKISLAPTDSLIRKEKVTDQLYNYYRTRSFICRETPLWKLVEAMNEAYSCNIVIERTELRNLTIDATFQEEKLDRLLELITQTFSNYQIRIVKEENRIILQ
jgi:ferric-dicitrate binding protein FerR (iron transport regulator)